MPIWLGQLPITGSSLVEVVVLELEVVSISPTSAKHWKLWQLEVDLEVGTKSIRVHMVDAVLNM